MVPAHAGTDSPLAQTNQVLHKSGLLQVRAIAHKAEPGGRTRIELRRGGDDIGQTFVQEDAVRFHTGLPLLIAAMNRDRSVEKALGKVVTWESDNRRGQQIIASQRNHFTEGYFNGAVSIHRGN